MLGGRYNRCWLTDTETCWHVPQSRYVLKFKVSAEASTVIHELKAMQG